MGNFFNLTLDRSASAVTITDISRTTISEVEGYNSCSFKFDSDENYTDFKIMVTENSTDLHDNVNNKQIPSTNGSTNMQGTGSFLALSPQTAIIEVDDLKECVGDIDGNYIIKVFVKNEAGLWCS